MPGRYIATGLYSEVVVNGGSTVYTQPATIALLTIDYLHKVQPIIVYKKAPMQCMQCDTKINQTTTS